MIVCEECGDSGSVGAYEGGGVWGCVMTMISCTSVWSVGMCEGWNGMGGGKSMKKVGGVVGKWWGEWKHERTVVGRMGVCGECWCTGKGAMDMECHAWECAMDMETFLKGSRDGCDRVCI